MCIDRHADSANHEWLQMIRFVEYKNLPITELYQTNSRCQFVMVAVTDNGLNSQLFSRTWNLESDPWRVEDSMTMKNIMYGCVCQLVLLTAIHLHSHKVTGVTLTLQQRLDTISKYKRSINTWRDRLISSNSLYSRTPSQVASSLYNSLYRQIIYGRLIQNIYGARNK